MTKMTIDEKHVSLPETGQHKQVGGITMKKQLHIQVNGFDIYLGISKNATHEEKELLKAYEQQQLRKEIELNAAKAEYDLQRLTA